MEPAVFIVEPQTIFLPPLLHAISAAGGRVARTATTLDPRVIAQLRAEYALLDLDYGSASPLDALAYFCAHAPSIRPIVLTAESVPGTTRSMHAAGAFAVVSKARDEPGLVDALRRILSGTAYFDPISDAL